MIDSGLVGRGTARVEDAQGTPTQSHISPSIPVYQEFRLKLPLESDLKSLRFGPTVRIGGMVDRASNGWVVPSAHDPKLTSFLFTLVTDPGRSLSLNLSETRVYEPQIRARLGTTAHFCKVVVKLTRR